MTSVIAGLMIGLFIPVHATGVANEPPAPSALTVADDVAGAQPPPPPPPPPDRPEAQGPGQPPPAGPERLGPPSRLPGPPPGAPPGGPPGLRRPLLGRPGLPAFPPRWEPLLRALRERRPELAERLERLRQEDPQRFQQVLLDALMMRIEDALNAAEAGPPPSPSERPGPPAQPGPEAPQPPHFRPPVPPPGEVQFERQTRELRERHEQLEIRSHELARNLRQLSASGAPPEEVQRLREELARVVNEQFEVRSELRRAELERIERELQRLREHIEKIRGDLETRQRERPAIIERRVNQLLGDEGGW